MPCYCCTLNDPSKQTRASCSDDTSLSTFSPIARSAAIRWRSCSMPEGCRPSRCRRSRPSSIIRRRRSYCRPVTRRTMPRCASSPCDPKFPSPAIPMSAPPSCWLRAPKRRRRGCCSRRRPGWCRSRLRARTERSTNAELTAPQPLKRLTQVSAEQAAACLSLSAADIRTDRHVAAHHFGRLAVPRRGNRLARSAEAGEAQCGGLCPNAADRRQRCDLFLHPRRARK